MSSHIIKVNVFVSPLEVVYYPFVCKFLFYNENVLKEIDNSLFYVEMVELRNHCFLVFQIALVLIDKGISFIDHISDVVEDCAVSASVHCCQFVSEVLVLLLFLLKLYVHVLYLMVVPL